MLTRRKVLLGAGAGAVSGCGGVAAAGSGGTETRQPATGDVEKAVSPDLEPLDRALTELHRTDPEFSGGLSNHGPMACEALEALGAPQRIEPFFARYRSRLEPMPPASELEDWTTALGRPEARAPLIASMEAELRRSGPDSLLEATLPQLLPGLIGGAFHGLLRTAHAYRSWTRRSSEPRARELAHGLGYWAARYQPLPGTPGTRKTPGRDAATTLERIPIVPDARRNSGLIFERFAALEDESSFADAVEQFDPGAQSPDAALDALVSTAARLFVTAKKPGAGFVYLHGVTGSAALRLLLPALSEENQQVAVGYLVQAVAAVHATHAHAGSSATQPVSAVDADPTALAAQAAQSDDDHTIKLVEAALREYEGVGSPELLAAAAHRLG